MIFSRDFKRIYPGFILYWISFARLICNCLGQRTTKPPKTIARATFASSKRAHRYKYPSYGPAWSSPDPGDTLRAMSGKIQETIRGSQPSFQAHQAGHQFTWLLAKTSSFLLLRFLICPVQAQCNPRHFPALHRDRTPRAGAPSTTKRQGGLRACSTGYFAYSRGD